MFRQNNSNQDNFILFYFIDLILVAYIVLKIYLFNKNKLIKPILKRNNYIY